MRVFGVDNPASGHEVAAEVAAEVVGRVSESDVTSWAEQKLSAYKRPSRITIIAGVTP